MSILKSKLCAWLFQVWEHVKNMDNTICKGWEKTSLLRSFNEQFQPEAMEMNVIRPLFSINFDSEIKQHDKDDDNIDLEDSMLEIME
jgi:hypothetical protein